MARAKHVLGFVLAAALAFGFAPHALAQDAHVYPGPFGEINPDVTEMSRGERDGGDPGKGVHFVVPDAQPGDGADADADDDADAADDDAGDDDAEAVGGTGGGDALANTGAEVEPIVAVSIGLLAVGGSAVVGSRRRVRNLFS